MNKSMIMAAMAAVAMTSCSNNEFDGPEVPTEGDRMELKIGTGVDGMTTRSAITRAPISTNDNVTADFLCFIATQDGGSINTDTLSTLYDKTTGTFTANAAAQAVSLTKILYYPGDKDESNLHAYVAGVHPAGGTLNNQTVTFASTDGQQDVMFAKPVDFKTAQAAAAGSVSASLEFSHQTSQLYFMADTVAHNPTTGGAFAGPVTIKSIEVINAQVPKSMNVATGAITWTNKANLSVQNVSSEALTNELKSVCDPVMVAPSAEIRLNVVITVNGVDKTFPNVLIKRDATSNLVSVVGKKHKISLKFNAPAYADQNKIQLNVSASVIEWAEGDSGEAEL